MLTNILIEWREMFTLPRPFHPASLEQQYQDDYCRRFAGQRRAVIFLGAASWVAFLAWDLIHAAHNAQVQAALQALIGLRLAGFVLLMGAGLWALGSWFEQSEQRATALLVSGNLALAMLAFAMMLLVPLDHAFRYYYFGLLMSIVFAFGVLRLRAETILWLMVTYGVGGTLLLRGQVLLSNDPDSELASITAWKQSNILISIGVIGTAFGIQLERTQRASYLRESELARYNQAITAHSREVEFLNASIRRSSEVAEERSRALIKLKDQMREEAERRDQEKSQFLANAVHDLKQPLQAIGNALEPAHRRLRDGDKAQAAAMISLAQQATHRMRHLLNAILEMSRLESGYVRAEMADVDVLRLARDVLAQLGDEAGRHGVRLTLVAPELDRVAVHTDPHFLTRVLLNLVGNGIKYRDPSRLDAWVRVTVSLHPAAVALQVDDNRVGIDPRHLESGRVFRPFYQAGTHRAQGETGVGLGLSIVSAMLALMPDHVIRPHSALGSGTSMRLDLPHGDERALMPAVQDPPDASALALRGLYVLLVEDDDLVRRSTGALLSSYGVLYEAVASTHELSVLLPRLERIPDLVLTDLRLPGGQSAHTLMDLVTQHFGPLPCVVMTGEKVSDDDLAPLEVSSLLLKPVSTSALLAAISRAAQPRHEPTRAPAPESHDATLR